MAYTTPKTYTAGNTLTAADLNTYQRDNITFLKAEVDTVKTPTVAFQRLASDTNLTEQLVTWTETGLSTTITPRNTYAMVQVHLILRGSGTIASTNNYWLYLDLALGGSRISGNSTGLFQLMVDDSQIACHYVMSGLTAAASNTISVQYLNTTDDAEDDYFVLQTESWIQVVDLP